MQKQLNNLFKPHKFETFDFQAFLDLLGITFKQSLKIDVEEECSKSIDESCINTDCIYNFVRIHQDELYQEVLQEIQDERKAIEDRNKRDMAKYYGTSFGGSDV